MRPELTGFEIVVATASNDAAANVTAEIPSIDAVRGAEEAALAADYFTALASHVLGARAWGMVAAVLGNMKNRSAFGQRFWFGPGSAADSRTATGRVKSRADAVPDVLGMLGILQQARTDPAGVPPWDEAVAAFRRAEREVRRLTAERQEAADTLAEYTRSQAAVRTAEEQVQRGDADRTNARARLEHSTVRHAGEQAALDRVDSEYDKHAARRPGFWVALSTFFRASREWYAESVALSARRTDLGRRVDAAAELVRQDTAALATKDQECRRAEQVLRDARRDHDSVRERVRAVVERWPGTVPFTEDLPDDEAFQLLAPWADEEFTLARNHLYLESLRLHKAFILNSEAKVRGNLAVAMTAIRGRLELKPETRLAAWQTLFLVVPMVSTTFASLPRLFAEFGRESLGWLFIDEAGQATPQQAVGGLWRARRAVIVGDPQQLEPIVTLPLPAQEAILTYHGVHEQWTPEVTSVQRIADRLASHGTTLAEADGDSTVWVGAPLRVHRRCDRPIFDISNTIAYGGDLMVYGTVVYGDYPGRHGWLDVRPGQSQGNWVPAEGEALAGLLGDLVADGVNTADIRVISPFRDVVRGSKNLVRPQFGPKFADRNVGTVHTVQGQESDVIILILAAHPGTSARVGGPPRSRTCSTWPPPAPNAASTSSATGTTGKTSDTSRYSPRPCLFCQRDHTRSRPPEMLRSYSGTQQCSLALLPELDPYPPLWTVLPIHTGTTWSVALP